jgi:hypothetical protein
MSYQFDLALEKKFSSSFEILIEVKNLTKITNLQAFTVE